MTNKNKTTEHLEQRALIQWARFSEVGFPELKVLFAIPNGAFYGGDKRTNAMRSNRMKAEGLRPGVPDLMLPVARRGFHGLFIEMKSEKGVLSPEQLEWSVILRSYGYKAVISRSFEQAKDVLVEYLTGDHK